MIFLRGEDFILLFVTSVAHMESAENTKTLPNWVVRDCIMLALCMPPARKYKPKIHVHIHTNICINTNIYTNTNISTDTNMCTNTNICTNTNAKIGVSLNVECWPYECHPATEYKPKITSTTKGLA